MPTILVLGGFRFFFYSRENQEPAHIHVEYGDKLAKYWLSPLELASSKRFRDHELNQVRALVLANRETFVEAWNDYFDAER
ncbi:MAG: DUF4160 domain-containing protein [Devosia sp.]